MIYFQDNIRDITDSLIDHCDDRKLDENANVQMSDEKIVGIVNDLFGAGRNIFFFTFIITGHKLKKSRILTELLCLF